MVNFRDYYFPGDIDLKGTEKLHNLVVQYRDQFLRNEPLQELLLNDGCKLEKPVTSFHELRDNIYLRTATSLHLSLVEKLTELATKPSILVVNHPLIIPYQTGQLMGQVPTEEERITQGGFDAETVESIQTEWMRNPKVGATVREYKDVLERAFGEFNLKFVLYRMYRALMSNIPDEWKQVYRIQGRIKKAFGEKRDEKLASLDNAYYNTAKKFLGGAGGLWSKLNQTDFGRKFLLTNEELVDGMRKVWR
jgi:hypothetical protein